MARIQIPLDVFTSRFNLSDRFAGVRSQSIAARFSNLRPISEFLDLKRLSKPANFGEVQSRVNYNLGHFSSNYAAVFVMLSIYSLVTNLTLTFVIVLVVGGMWAIGKLDGRDLEIGTARVTSSQLYTGLLIIAIPLGFIASPFSTILWLIGASGGLGGRPRSPKSVPPWGRPPGAKGSKQRKKWEREQAIWQEQVRVEELDSDDTDVQGVGVNFAGRRFVSDPLQFTGADLASKSRTRKSYAYGSDSDTGTSYSEDDGNESAVQIALKDKEEALVQSALARIRRAQEKGKKEVKLREDEVAALERRRKRMQSTATSKSRKGSDQSGSGSDKRRKNDKAMVTIPIVQPETRRTEGRRRSDRDRHENSPPRSSSGPGLLYEGPDGQSTFAPVGYYPVSSRNSPTRPHASSSPLQHSSRHTPPPQLSYNGSRHASDGARPTSSGSVQRRPLPDEEGWMPGSRRSSVSSQPYSPDPFDYQISSGHPPPIPKQYAQSSSVNRRNTSGPPEVQYSVRRSPTVGAYPISPQRPYSAHSSSSDPNHNRRRSGVVEIIDSGSSPSSDDDDDSDDLGNGGGVSVEPQRTVAVVPKRKPVAGRKKGRR